MTDGIVYLVGAGPGDPGLVTHKGRTCIRKADVIVYDRLISPALVAQSRPDAEKVYVGKQRDCHAQDQAAINRLLAERALEGKVVCRLKGGDPFLFGRGGEEAELLAVLGIPFEVIPGVTSGIAVPAYAGIPVTHRGISGSVAMVTGHEAPCKGGAGAVDWSRMAKAAETLLIYMGVEALPEIAERLTRCGRPADTPVAVIRWGTRAEQATVVGTLATIAGAVREAALRPPAMIVVGNVVGLRERLSWAEAKPLFGRRLLLPTLGEEGHPLAEELRHLGAEVWEWPVATVAGPLDWAPVDAAIGRLSAYTAISFAGAEPVGGFIRRLRARGKDLRALADLRIVAADEAAAAAIEQLGLATEPPAEEAGPAVLHVGMAGRTALPHAVATCRAVPRFDTAGILQEALREGAVREILLTAPEVLAPLLEMTGGLDGVRILSTTEAAADAAREAGLPALHVVSSAAQVLDLLTEGILLVGHG